MNSAVFTINGDIDVSDCSWEACTSESNWLTSLNSTESRGDSGKIGCHSIGISDGICRGISGSIDVDIWETLMGCDGAVDRFDTEELDLIQSDSILFFS